MRRHPTTIQLPAQRSSSNWEPIVGRQRIIENPTCGTPILRPPMRGFLALVAFLVVGCGDIIGSSSSCEGKSVVVTVSPGTTPQFGWTPGCAMSTLTVNAHSGDGGQGPVMWSTALDSELRPPVTYGVHPSGVEEYEQAVAVPLESGSTYRLVLIARRGWFTSGAVTGFKFFAP